MANVFQFFSERAQQLIDALRAPDSAQKIANLKQIVPQVPAAAEIVDPNETNPESLLAQNVPDNEQDPVLPEPESLPDPIIPPRNFTSEPAQPFVLESPNEQDQPPFSTTPSEEEELFRRFGQDIYGDLKPFDRKAFDPSHVINRTDNPLEGLLDFETSINDPITPDPLDRPEFIDPVDEFLPPPVFELIDPDSGLSAFDEITNSNSFNVVGNGPENAVIRIFSNGALIAVGESDALGDFEIPVTLEDDGVYQFTLDAQRDGLTSEQTAPIEITLDTVPPDPILESITVDSNNPLLPGTEADLITNDTSPTLNIAVEPNAFVTVRLDGNDIGTFQANAEGQLAVDLSNLTDNRDYNLEFDSEDIAGNIGDTNNFTFTIDTVTDIPTIDLNPESDSGTSDTDNLTNVTLPTFSGTAEANGTVEVFVNGVSVGNAFVNELGEWTLTLSGTPLPDGFYDLTVTSTDIAGNQAATAEPLSIEIDTSIAVTIDDSDANDGFLNAEEVENFFISGITDLNSNINDQNVLVLEIIDVNGNVVLTVNSEDPDGIELGLDGEWVYSADLTGSVPDGADYTIRVTATDTAGNTTTDEITNITVDTQITTPTIDLADSSDSSDESILGDVAQGDNQDDLTNIPQPLIQGTADPGDTVEVFDANSNSLGTALVAGDGTWQLQLSQDLTEGPNTLTAIATDPAGNVSDPASLIVTLDSQIATPTINLADDSDTGALDSDNLTNIQLVTLNGTAEAGSTIQIFRDGEAEPIATTLADPDGNWQVENINLIEGDNALTAVSTDAAGNTAPAADPLIVTLDTQSPELSINLQNIINVLNVPDLAFNNGPDQDNNFDYLTNSDLDTVNRSSAFTIDLADDGLADPIEDSSGEPNSGFVVITNNSSDGNTLSTSNVEGDLGLEPNALQDAATDESKLTDASYTRYSIYAQEGDVITFDWNFINAENREIGPKDDHAFVVINGEVIKLTSSNELNVLDDDDSLVTFNQQSGWATFSFTVTETGTQNIAFIVTNEGTDVSKEKPDEQGDSALAIDNLSINGSVIQNQDVDLNVSFDFDDPNGATFTSATIDATLASDFSQLTLTNDNSGTGIINNADGTWTITDEAAFEGLRFTYAEGYTDLFNLSIEITVTDTAGNETTDSSSTTINIQNLENTVYNDDASSANNDYVVGDEGDNTVNADAGDDLIDAGAGNDTIDAGAGIDTLIGGQGNDTLTGGAGQDVFFFQQGDQGTSVTPAVDTITDFEVGTDTIDLKNLLQGESLADLTNYISVSYDGSDTTFDITTQGDGSGVDQSIVVEGVDLVGGSTNPQEILNTLLQQGVITVDTG